MVKLLLSAVLIFAATPVRANESTVQQLDESWIEFFDEMAKIRDEIQSAIGAGKNGMLPEEIEALRKRFKELRLELVVTENALHALKGAMAAERNKKNLGQSKKATRRMSPDPHDPFQGSQTGVGQIDHVV